MAINFADWFGADLDSGEIVFPQQVGEPFQLSTQNHHVGGRERDREFLRRRRLPMATSVSFGVRVWFQRVINQLAGLETVAVVWSTTIILH
jgi:hypothetical protein